jgi:hypothetical protein
MAAFAKEILQNHRAFILQNAELSREIQKKYGYDPAGAAGYSASRGSSQAALI